MAKVHKYWNIHTDLDIGSTADKRIFVEDDAYSYVLNLSFVKNRRFIADLYALQGSFWLKFFLPNETQLEYEIADIDGDRAQFPIPIDVLQYAGKGELHVEWRNDLGELLNEPTPLEFIILESPWEVS